jgi:hypothetical protein
MAEGIVGVVIENSVAAVAECQRVNDEEAVAVGFAVVVEGRSRLRPITSLKDKLLSDGSLAII